MTQLSYICAVCPHKESIFVGPQIREVLKDKEFKKMLTLKLRAREAFKSVYLGNRRPPDCQDCVEKFLQTYKHMGCRTSPMIHFSQSHLNFFPPNHGAVRWKDSTMNMKEHPAW